jgi:hypothetical protein
MSLISDKTLDGDVVSENIVTIDKETDAMELDKGLVEKGTAPLASSKLCLSSWTECHSPRPTHQEEVPFPLQL